MEFIEGRVQAVKSHDSPQGCCKWLAWRGLWQSVQLWREKFCDRRNSNRCDSETQGRKGKEVQYLINKHVIQNKIIGR